MESRRRLSDQQWQQLFVRFESCTQTVQEFCQTEGLSVSNFYRRRSSTAVATGHTRNTHRDRQMVEGTLIGGGFVDLGCLSAPVPPSSKTSGATLSVRIDLGGGVILQIERS
jgi:hypothetical protein